MGFQFNSLEIDNEEKYRLISDFTYDWEEWRAPSGELIYVSPACERITGYPIEAFLADTNFLLSIIHPQDLVLFEDHLRDSHQSTTENSQLEFRIIHKSGEEKWISHYCVPVFHKNGTWIGRRESNREITDRKKTEAELFQTKQQLEIILSNIDTIVFSLDKAGRLVYANQAAANIAGFSSSADLVEHGQILDKFDIIDQTGHPLPLINLSVAAAVEQLANSRLTIRYNRVGSNEQNWAILSGRPIYSADGALEMLVVIAQDITELKDTQLELQKSQDELEERVEIRTKELEKINQELLAEINTRKRVEIALQQERDFSLSLIQTAQIGMLVLDTKGKILQINPFFEQISGYTLEEVYQKNWFETFLFPQDRQTIEELFSQAIRNLPTRGNITPIRTKQGQSRLIEWHDKTLKDNQGKVIGLLATGQDVTESKAIEEKVLKNAAQAQAQASITSRINADLDLNTVLSSVCEELVKAIPAIKTSAIMLVDPENEEILSFAAGYGPDMGLKDQLRPVPVSNYYNDLSIHGSLLVVPDINAIQNGPNLEIARIIQARSVINAIMVHHDNIVGVIHLITHREPYIPSEEDLSFIQSLANHATIAIVNARLFQQISENRKHLKVLSQRLVKIQETERRNISRELHDEIGQELTSLILILEIIKNTSRKETLSTRIISQKLDEAQELVNVILKQIRELALDLRPGMLDDLGLLPALIMHFDRFSKQTEIIVNFKHSGIQQRFSGEIETTAFRIIQEALTNVVRHAKVKEVNVRLWTKDRTLMIQIQDDGTGFNREEILRDTTRIGLLGMQERAALCGGNLDIEAQPGLGTCLTIEIPLFLQENTNVLKNSIG